MRRRYVAVYNSFGGRYSTKEMSRFVHRISSWAENSEREVIACPSCTSSKKKPSLPVSREIAQFFDPFVPRPECLHNIISRERLTKALLTP
jgi:hypothetical protein